MDSDGEQIRMDLDEANLRLERLATAIQARDDAEAQVQLLTAELKGARRKLKEATWNVGSLLRRESNASKRGK